MAICHAFVMAFAMVLQRHGKRMANVWQNHGKRHDKRMTNAMANA